MEAHDCKQLLSGIRVPVVAADEGLRVRFLNPAAERALSMSQAEAEGQGLRELLRLEGETDAPWRLERTEGGWAAYGEGVPAEEGEAGGAWLHRLVEAQQLAAVGQLAAGVAHEIGAPLTAISVAVEYLLKGPAGQDPAVARDLELVLAQTQRIARLSRRLVDLARPGEPRLVPMELNRAVEEGYELVEKQLRRSGVEGVLRLDPGLPPVRGDAHQLQQVLLNLMLNALRAVQSSGRSEKRVEVATRARSDAVELVVTDTGAGIEEADLPKIFLPFFSRAGGPGLGLALARSIVHQHGGTIRAESPVGRGATFTVRLPRESDGHPS